MRWTTAVVMTIGLVAIPSAAVAQSGTDELVSKEMARIRSSNPGIVALVARATEQSRTFREMVAAIGASDGIVYVERGTCGHGVRACFRGVTKAGANRVLWLWVDIRKTDEELIASIGHELRHAIEVLGNPRVTSNASMYIFYLREGFVGTAGAFETRAAIDAGLAVKADLHSFKRQMVAAAE